MVYEFITDNPPKYGWFGCIPSVGNHYMLYPLVMAEGTMVGTLTWWKQTFWPLWRSCHTLKHMNHDPTFGNQTLLARKSTINKGLHGNIIYKFVILHFHLWFPNIFTMPWPWWLWWPWWPWPRQRNPWRWHYRPPESCLAGRDSRTLEDLQRIWPGSSDLKCLDPEDNEDPGVATGILSIPILCVVPCDKQFANWKPWPLGIDDKHDDLPVQNWWCSSSLRSTARGGIPCLSWWWHPISTQVFFFFFWWGS